MFYVSILIKVTIFLILFYIYKEFQQRHGSTLENAKWAVVEFSDHCRINCRLFRCGCLPACARSHPQSVDHDLYRVHWAPTTFVFNEQTYACVWQSSYVPKKDIYDRDHNISIIELERKQARGDRDVAVFPTYTQRMLVNAENSASGEYHHAPRRNTLVAVGSTASGVRVDANCLPSRIPFDPSNRPQVQYPEEIKIQGTLDRRPRVDAAVEEVVDEPLEDQPEVRVDESDESESDEHGEDEGGENESDERGEDEGGESEENESDGAGEDEDSDDESEEETMAAKRRKLVGI
jgi:hypothetical protein